MARPRSRGRGKRRIQRGRGRSGGYTTALLGLVAALLILGMGYLFWWSSRTAAVSAVDPATLCPTATGPTAMTAILIDLTDPLAPAQAAQLRAWLTDEVGKAGQGTQFTMGVVSEGEANWGATTPLCKPQEASTANALTQNVGLISERYQARFMKPLEENIARLMTATEAKQSPIMESLQALVAGTPGFVTFQGPRRIILVSDLLQHSDALSFYGGGDWDSFRRSPAFQRIGSTLSDAQVVIYQIPRPLEGVDDPAVLEDFWARYFDQQGAHLPSLKRLGDL